MAALEHAHRAPSSNERASERVCWVSVCVCLVRECDMLDVRHSLSYCTAETPQTEWCGCMFWLYSLTIAVCVCGCVCSVRIVKGIECHAVVNFVVVFVVRDKSRRVNRNRLRETCVCVCCFVFSQHSCAHTKQTYTHRYVGSVSETLGLRPQPYNSKKCWRVRMTSLQTRKWYCKHYRKQWIYFQDIQDFDVSLSIFIFFNRLIW